MQPHILLLWFCHGILSVPASFYARSNQAFFATESVTPINSTQGFAVLRNKLRVGFISALCGTGSPYAVFRAVPIVVIDSLYCMVRRGLRPHIGIEAHEVIIPAMTDSDASGDIILNRGRSVAVTPSSHVNPCSVLRSAGHSMYTLTSHFTSPISVFGRGLGADTPSAPNYTTGALA